MTVVPKRSLMSLEPYDPGPLPRDLAASLGRPVIPLNANESPYGHSPSAEDRILKVLREGLNRYPDPLARELRGALSRHWGLPEDCFLVDNGLDGVITLLGITFLEEGDEVLHGGVTFSVYRSLAGRLGARSVEVPMRGDWSLDLKGFAERITPRTKLVFLCNPNNPTGTVFSHGELQEFLEKVPPGVLVVCDEAYGDFADLPDFPRTAEMIAQRDNLVMLRTFSKAYGLAGLRVGYIAGSKRVISHMRRAKEPYSVNALALAGALGALEDMGFLRSVVERVIREREELQGGLSALGVSFVRSYGNFVFLLFGASSDRVFHGLVERGIMVRHYGPLGAVRVTVGRPEENRAFLDALKEVLLEVRLG
ncbi:histidinol-phosphate aminotransferase [Thermanaerovibrio velox DSM 12556]|uniref:Histidinol-phosphate aminotransferase n=1 Tax=Thermanaerovibrio velox DSM 12556 TaxID=926567 RepID=H0UPX6_9BACT|nr:histidinol-phosphate transaminase [Thermanaerovibrio velox]EHM10685.1 histidinol-phosphate aminotransferase [Thermanaerovibrio velox DSM 12556]